MDPGARGKVQTVCGLVEPKTLGITLTHEHLNHKAVAEMFKPRAPEKYGFLGLEPFDPENLWWINFHPYSHLDNLTFDDLITKDALMKEMKFFKDNGGGTIVENTSFSRDIHFLQELSVKSGVNIIAGTGFYVAPGQTPASLGLSMESMYETFMSELTVGIDGIRCGIIGEIGTCYPLHDFERRSLIAAAHAQQELKVPVNIHPGRDKRSPFEVMRIFLEAGGLIHRTVMSHLERTLLDDVDLFEFAALGTFCEFDLFGVETSYYELSDELDMPSDAVRIQRLKSLVKEGFLESIVISHDIHTKHRLMKFGGHGFSHILMNVITQMKRRGFSQEQIDQIVVKNPRKWLTL